MQLFILFINYFLFFIYQDDDDGWEKESSHYLSEILLMPFVTQSYSSQQTI
jgi:hypothetical protein